MRARILDPTFRYVPAAKTNVRRTIQRERARLKAEARAVAQAANDAEAAAKVAPITTARKVRA